MVWWDAPMQLVGGLGPGPPRPPLLNPAPMMTLVNARLRRISNNVNFYFYSGYSTSTVQLKHAFKKSLNRRISMQPGENSSS